MKDFDLILDDCLNRLARGETLDGCLARYPQQSGKLRPALLAVSRVKEASVFVPSAGAKTVARQRFYRARADISAKTRRSILSRLAYWPIALAAMAAVLAIALLAHNSLQPGTRR